MAPLSNGESSATPPPSNKFYTHLKTAEEELARLGEEIIGEPCHLATGLELEFVGVLSAGASFDENPITQLVRKELFHSSPYVLKILREPRVGRTPDDTVRHNADTRIGVQLELVTGYKTRQTHKEIPSREAREAWKKSPEGEAWREARRKTLGDAYKPQEEISSYELADLLGYEKRGKPRIISAAENARILEILPWLLSREAIHYGLEDIKLTAVPFISENSQTSGLQPNLNLVNSKGENLFDNKGRASPLMLCFLLELIESDKDALALFAPTPEAYKRFKQFAAPQNHGLTARRIIGHFGSMIIRGRGYEARRAAGDGIEQYDPDLEPKEQDAGGTRVEHRLPCPEAITCEPKISPYIFMEYYVQNMKRALLRYHKLQQEGKLDSLNEMDLFNALKERDEAHSKGVEYTSDNPLVQQEPFPTTWFAAVDRFKSSLRMKELLGEESHAAICNILETEKQKSASKMSR